MLKTYDTREAAPEPLRAGAIESKDGKFIVDEPDPALGDKGAAALEKERKARKDADDARKAAEKERDELKVAAEAAAKGITTEALEKIRADEAAKAKPLQDELAALKAENRKLKLYDRVQAVALSAGVMKERIAKAMKDLSDRVDLTEDGNSIVVKDAKGNVTTETIEDFLAKTYKAESPFFYAGTNGSGSGAEGESGAGAGGYDPVAAGKKAAAEQKKSASENALAFR